MQMQKKGMSVVLFSFLWLVITGGTVLSALHFGKLNHLSHGLSEIKTEYVPAIGSKFISNHFDWGDTPLEFESSFLNKARNDKKNNNANLPKSSLKVFESLCNLIMSGTEDELREVFPPEYVESLEDKYGAIINVVGGFDNAIKQIIKLNFGSMIEEIGSLRSVTYKIDYSERLHDESFKKTLADLKDAGVSCRIDAAYKIKLILIVYGDKGTNNLYYNCVLIKTGTDWFLSPSGLTI